MAETQTSCGTIPQMLQEARGLGYQLINALYDTNGDNVYHVIALSRDPAAWEPYRAPRYLKDSDSYALTLEFDQEDTVQNMAGEFIYTAADPEDLEEGEAPQEVNADIFSLYEEDENPFEDLSPDLSQQVRYRLFDILRALRGGQGADRWDGVIRTDLEVTSDD